MSTIRDDPELAAGQRLRTAFRRQHQASRECPCVSYDQRRKYLSQLARLLTENQDAIARAIGMDFGGRSSHETRLLEVFNLVSGIHYTRRRLKHWMRPQRRHVGMAFPGASNRVIPQPKGVVGIVTPWNYPLFLALSPCTSAIAAGNRCIIKLAANSQNLACLLDALLQQYIDDDFVVVIPGVSARDFTDIPWDHLVFTGSPATARTVMATAARHLTPVTLELGGKSPAILAGDFPMELAAERLLMAKFMNAGQTCVAPDYVFVERKSVDDFVECAQRIMSERYPDLSGDDYTSIIDDRAYARLTHLLHDAENKGARVVNLAVGELAEGSSRKIAPHLVLDPTHDMRVMQDEIFGPILPVLPYDSMDEVISHINRNERPLALYLYSRDRGLQDRVVYNTLSGGVCINDCILHVAQHDMPFGGVGNSGMGQYHGREGFNEFSKLRPVFSQARFSGMRLLAPPYGRRFDVLYHLMLKLKL